MVRKKVPSSHLTSSFVSVSASSVQSSPSSTSSCHTTSVSESTSPITLGSTDRKKTSAADCPRFESQVWRPSKCMVCFHDRDLHSAEAIRASLQPNSLHAVVAPGLVKDRVEIFSSIDTSVDVRPSFDRQNSTFVKSLVEAAESRRGSEDGGSARRGSEDFTRSSSGLDVFDEARFALSRNWRSSEKGGKTPTSRSPRRIAKSLSSSALDRPFDSSAIIHVPHKSEINTFNVLSSSCPFIPCDSVKATVIEPASEVYGTPFDIFDSSLLQVDSSVPPSTSFPSGSGVPAAQIPRLPSFSPDLESLLDISESLAPSLPDMPPPELLSSITEPASMLVDLPILPSTLSDQHGFENSETQIKQQVETEFSATGSISLTTVSGPEADSPSTILTILYRGDISDVLSAYTCRAPLPSEILQGEGVLPPTESPFRVQLLLRPGNDPEAVHNLLVAKFSLRDHACLYLCRYDGSPVNLDASLEPGAYLLFSHLPYADAPSGSTNFVTPPRPPVRKPESFLAQELLAPQSGPSSSVSQHTAGVSRFLNPVGKVDTLQFSHSSFRFPQSALSVSAIAPSRPYPPTGAERAERGAIVHDSIPTAFSYVSPSVLSTVHLNKRLPK